MYQLFAAVRANCVVCTARLLDSGTVSACDRSAYCGYNAFDMAHYFECDEVQSFLLEWRRTKKRRRANGDSAASSALQDSESNVVVAEVEWVAPDDAMEDAATEPVHGATAQEINGVAAPPCSGDHLPPSWRRSRRNSPRYHLYAAAKDGCVHCTRRILESGEAQATDRSESGMWTVRDFAAYASQWDVLAYLDERAVRAVP